MTQPPVPRHSPWRAESREFAAHSDVDAWHELKNELNVILAYSQLLLGRLAPDDTRRRDLAEIYASADRIRTLIPALQPSEARTS